jgi:hypothetical protein
LIETAEPVARRPLSAEEANTSDAGEDQVVSDEVDVEVERR